MKLFVLVTIAALLGSSLGVDTDALKEQFQQLLEKLKQIGLSALANAAQQAIDAGKASLVDILAKLKESGLGLIGKRSLGDDVFAKAADIYNKIRDAVEKNAAKAKLVYIEAIDKLKDIVANLKDSDFYLQLQEKVQEIKDKIDAALNTHKIGMRSVEEDLISDIDVAIAKRGLGTKISDFFKPHIAKIQAQLQNLGDAAKGHLETLAEKLKPHLEKIKTQGKDALDAIKQAVTDILDQTVKDMAGTIKDAIDTGVDDLVDNNDVIQQ